MKASELIQKLIEQIALHGDKEVTITVNGKSATSLEVSYINDND